MKFAIYAKEGISRRSRDAVDIAIRAVDRSFREWDKRIDDALLHPELSKASKKFIREQWYGDPRGRPLSLGNRAVHRASTIANIITLLVHAQSEPVARKGRFRLRMISTCADLGICDFGAPSINMLAVGRHFDQAVRSAGVGAFGFIDLAVLEDRLGLTAPKIAFHMHAAMRAENDWFRVKTAEGAASPRLKPQNQLGLKVIKISSKRRDWGPSLKRRHVALLGYYVSKRSCGRKIIFDDNGSRKTVTTLDRWSCMQVLRQLECYSHCDVLETTRGVGLGKQLRAQWKTTLLRLLAYRTPLRGLKIDHDELTRHWAQIWLELGNPQLSALRVHRRPE